MLLFNLFYKLPYVLSAYVLPCYSSYNAILKNDSVKQNRWLAYWMVLSLCECLFVVTDYFFLSSWFYQLLKLVFILWIAVPSKGGTDFITTVIVNPILDNNSTQIDNALNRAFLVVFSKLKEAVNRLIDYIPNLIRLGNKINAEKIE